VRHIGSLPVLDSKKALVGIITETDIFKIAAGMLRARPVVRKSAAKTVRRRRRRPPSERNRQRARRFGAVRRANCAALGPPSV